MKILLSGSSGLIGSALMTALFASGHTVVPLIRKTPKPGRPGFFWDPEKGVLNHDSLENFDAMIHLAGESIASGRWTAAKKARIRDSRVKGTRLLADMASNLNHPPRTFICASAIGFYGDRGNELLRETSAPGRGFLADVCRFWESATALAAKKGIRVVNLRFGAVLSPLGGALAKMLPPFRLGVGGKIGSGRQFMSWIALDDAVGSILHVLKTPSLQGPVNGVAPHPVTNAEFTKTLGQILGKPALIPMPALAARLAFGQMAQELLLTSQRVEPAKLLASGYGFRFPDLPAALRHLVEFRKPCSTSNTFRD